MNLTNDEEKLLSKIKKIYPEIKEIINKLRPGTNYKYLFKRYLIVFQNKDDTFDIVSFNNLNEFKKQYKTFKNVRLFQDFKKIHNIDEIN